MRDYNLRGIRPVISTIIMSDNMSQDERFQSLVLRPVIVMQNDLLIAAFKNYIRKHKSVFFELSVEQRMSYIENAIQRDMKFRNSLKGMIIGLFTIEEYELYTENSSALNKRMMHIVKERLLSQLQIFDRNDILEAV